MGSRVLQYSFIGGEIAPAMLGRLDNPLYQQGAARIENFVVEPTGALLTRPGFRFVGQARDNGNVRLIPFRFSSEQTLVLVFTDKKMRIATEGKWLMNGESMFEIDSPYAGEDLFDIDYSQVADIITLTSRKYPPTELRRKGATDWEFSSITVQPSITPPSTVSIVANYPDGTDSEDKNIVTVRYKVTAIDANGKESVASTVKEGKCNYYLTGASVTLSWSAVAGAVRYRVYRDVAGIYGFISETEETSITDQGDFTPDTTTTPPLYDNPFLDKTGIKEVEVLDGGSGYPNASDVLNSANPTSFKLRMPMYVVTSTTLLGGVSPEELTLTFVIKDGNSGSELASCSVPYVCVATQSQSHTSGGSVYSYLYAPKDYLTTNGILELNFASYSSTDAFLHLRSFPEDGWFVESFGDTVVSKGWSKSHPETGNIISFGTISTVRLDKANWSFSNGMTKTLFGEMGGWRLSSGTAGVCIKQGNGGRVSTILQESGEDIDQFLKENGVKIEVSDPTGTGAVLEPIVEDGKIVSVTVIASGSNYTNPTLTVKSEKGSGAKLKAILFDEDDYDYPAANTQFDQRRVFAGTTVNPLKVWMTNAGQQDLMMYHFPTLADDRIELTAVTSDADMIRHAVALESLLLFTGSSELRVFSQNSDALTPESVAVRAQSYVGANNVQPVIANNVVLFAANRGGHLRALQYAYTSSGYTCTDLSMAACHLFDGMTIKDLALQKAPSQIVWAVSSNGSLLGLTFTPDQNTAAWHKHTTDGKFESVCVVTEGEEDHLYAVIAREINGETRKFIERMDNFTITDEKNARLLDSFIDNQPVSMAARSTDITGLEHLEGKTVKAYVDGVDMGVYTVQDGKITVAKGGTNVAVGLPYTSYLRTVPLAASAQGGLQGSVKNVGELFLRVKFSGDVWANTYPKQKMYLCKREDVEFAQQGQESKVVRLSVDGVWDYQGQVQIEHRNCLPLEVQAVVGNVSVEGA